MKKIFLLFGFIAVSFLTTQAFAAMPEGIMNYNADYTPAPGYVKMVDYRTMPQYMLNIRQDSVPELTEYQPYAYSRSDISTDPTRFENYYGGKFPTTEIMNVLLTTNHVDRWVVQNSGTVLQNSGNRADWVINPVGGPRGLIMKVFGDGEGISFTTGFQSEQIGGAMVRFIYNGTNYNDGTTGCTNPSAANYLTGASINDGTCIDAPQPSAVPGDGETTVSWFRAIPIGDIEFIGSLVVGPDGITKELDHVTSEVLFTGLTNGVLYTFTICNYYSSYKGPIRACSTISATPHRTDSHTNRCYDQTGFSYNSNTYNIHETMDTGFANECAALAKLYDETNGDNWTLDPTGTWFNENDLGLWMVQGGEYTGYSYHALRTQDGHIDVLQTNYNNLSGTVLSSLSNMPRLRVAILYHNNISAIDISQNTGLISVQVFENPLTTLDVTHNVNLSTISIHDAQLTGIDVSQNPALSFLSITNNSITGILDISHNPGIVHLEAGGNEITAVDLSNNTSLATVDLSENNLSTLDISHNIGISILMVDNNNLTGIDISQNHNLNVLYINDNNLHSLDMSQNTGIFILAINNNPLLSSLDLSMLPGLQTLTFSGDNLATLDLTNNTGVSNLNASHNNLQSLSVTGSDQYYYMIHFGGIADFGYNKLCNITDADALDFLNRFDPDRADTQIGCPVVPVSHGGGGGGGGLHKDICENGDISPSYYDNTCTALDPTVEKIVRNIQKKWTNLSPEIIQNTINKIISLNTRIQTKTDITVSLKAFLQSIVDALVKLYK